jgi:hypothetical protein
MVLDLGRVIPATQGDALLGPFQPFRDVGYNGVDGNGSSEHLAPGANSGECVQQAD